MTSTALFDRVGEFITKRETFNAYVERMEMFFTANNIVETTGEGSTQANRIVAERKPAIFLTEVGAEVYSTLSNLLAPTKPKHTLFLDIVRVLKKHYNPKPLEIEQSFHFRTRNQKSGESFGDYVLALKRLDYGEFDPTISESPQVNQLTVQDNKTLIMNNVFGVVVIIRK